MSRCSSELVITCKEKEAISFIELGGDGDTFAIQVNASSKQCVILTIVAEIKKIKHI